MNFRRVAAILSFTQYVQSMSFQSNSFETSCFVSSINQFDLSVFKAVVLQRAYTPTYTPRLQP